MRTQSVPRTPGGTPSVLSASSMSHVRAAGGVERGSQEGRRDGATSSSSGVGDGGIGRVGSSESHVGSSGGGGGGIGGPTASMLEFALRRKFANTRQSILQDRR